MVRTLRPMAAAALSRLYAIGVGTVGRGSLMREDYDDMWRTKRHNSCTRIHFPYAKVRAESLSESVPECAPEGPGHTELPRMLALDGRRSAMGRVRLVVLWEWDGAAVGCPWS